VNLYRPLAICW